MNEEANYTVGNYQITISLPNNGQMAISGYVYLNDTPDDLNKRMDMHVAVMNRQQRRAELPVLRAKLEGMEKQVKDMLAHMATLNAKSMHGEKLSSQEDQAFNAIPRNIKALEAEIETGKARIAELEAETA